MARSKYKEAKDLIILHIVFTLAVALLLLWLILLLPRRGFPGWEELSSWRYAHRGLHDLTKGRPENSMAAFRAAIDAGLGAELDVHLLADGSLAVVHDSDLSRVTGQRVLVEELTAADLPRFPLQGTEERIPLFGEVLALFEAMGLETALTAPTGRAAKRLGELCGTEASTIHRLLETGYDPHSGQMMFTHNSYEPLAVDAVIVDETSMVDVSLMAALLDAMEPDCRLVLVGDPDQLPSVGPGNVFSDLIRSRAVPTVRLTEIFRQAAESAIVRNAHAINKGQVPNLRANDNDFFLLCRRDGQSVVDTIVDLCRRRLPEHMGIPTDQIQVLSPTRRRTTGTGVLNQALQQALNPPLETKGERRFGDWVFRAGDRVMQVKNNYDILWRDEDGADTGMGIFNGDIGVIRAVEKESVTVDFDGRLVDYSPDMLGELEPAFAITVHKSQGSEYRAVVLAALDGASMLMTRGILYTAVTRARELFIVVGEPETVAAMIGNDRQTRRYSGLRARLAQEK